MASAGARGAPIDRNGDGAVDFQRAAPDFNLRSFTDMRGRHVLMVKASYWLGL